MKNHITGEIQYLNRLIHSCSEDSCSDSLKIQRFTARSRGSNTVHSRSHSKSHSRLCNIRFQKLATVWGFKNFGIQDSHITHNLIQGLWGIHSSLAIAT